MFICFISFKEFQLKYFLLTIFFFLLQEEEKRKIAEQELVKELRKRTTFKARPNPFTKK